MCDAMWFERKLGRVDEDVVRGCTVPREGNQSEDGVADFKRRVLDGGANDAGNVMARDRGGAF